jgi:hypothetical protein
MPRLHALILAIVLGVPAFAAPQTPATAPPKEILGTWIWNPTSRTELDNYQCYVERIDDIGAGRTRVRDHRIRLVKGADRQVIRNDFDVFFNTPIMRADRTSMLWRITGPLSYQLMTLPARGGPPTFVVTRDISADGQRMTQVGQGVVNGVTVRSRSTFDRAPDGTMSVGECTIE